MYHSGGGLLTHHKFLCGCPADIVVLYLLNDSLASLSSDRQEALGVTKYSKNEQAIAERQWLCIPVVAETYTDVGSIKHVKYSTNFQETTCHIICL